MRNNSIRTKSSKNIRIFFLLFALICLIYSNTLNASWHFDDEPNILLNPSLHLTNFHLKSLAETFISRSDWSAPKLYRPISCFTLALNWYFGQDDPTGYHLVNIGIHIITAFFLFLVLLQIMQLITTSKEENSKKYFVALLAATLWATAPIQTQAVTYIVQRMASLAAMFTILAIYSYLKARTEKKSIRWSALTFLFFLAGIGSKENAIMLPASLLFLEFSFFRHHLSNKKIGWIAVASSITLLLGLLAAHFLLGRNILNIFDLSRLIDSYEGRSFTLHERILTEPRIVLMYLSQIFIPLVSRLSLVHDIQLSTSLFTLWTTLPAIITIFILIGLSIFFLKKHPLFCFPVLFFFLNHIIESTILPLELIFEHRNYLPSFFLFLPISFLIGQAIYTPNKFSSVGRFAIATGTVCFLILFGQATYTRNFTWANENTLWKDATEKAPNSARAANFMGRWLKKKKKNNEALYYYQRGLQTAEFDPSPKVSILTAIGGITSIYYDSGQYEKAIFYLNQGLKIEEKDQYCLTKRAQSYIQLDLPQKALNDAEVLSTKYPFYPLGKYLAASASYRLGELAEAQKYMQEIIKNSLDKPKGLYLMGLILLKYKSYPNALFFLRKAADLWPDNAEYQLVLAAAYYVSNQSDASEETLRNIFTRFPLPTLERALQNIPSDYNDNGSLMFVTNTLADMLQAEL